EREREHAAADPPAHDDHIRVHSSPPAAPRRDFLRAAEPARILARTSFRHRSGRSTHPVPAEVSAMHPTPVLRSSAALLPALALAVLAHAPLTAQSSPDSPDAP